MNILQIYNNFTNLTNNKIHLIIIGAGSHPISGKYTKAVEELTKIDDLNTPSQSKHSDLVSLLHEYNDVLSISLYDQAYTYYNISKNINDLGMTYNSGCLEKDKIKYYFENFDNTKLEINKYNLLVSYIHGQHKQPLNFFSNSKITVYGFHIIPLLDREGKFEYIQIIKYIINNMDLIKITIPFTLIDAYHLHNNILNRTTDKFKNYFLESSIAYFHIKNLKYKELQTTIKYLLDNHIIVSNNIFTPDEVTNLSIFSSTNVESIISIKELVDYFKTNQNHQFFIEREGFYNGIDSAANYNDIRHYILRFTIEAKIENIPPNIKTFLDIPYWCKIETYEKIKKETKDKVLQIIFGVEKVYSSYTYQ
jgi:hypothetical protein